MLYAVGEKIDLRDLNTKKAVATQPKKSTLAQALDAEVNTLYQAGTQVRFTKEGGIIRRIPVTYYT